ncbi:MAG: LysR family transcriptional regulator [Puniceicoccales bacterium]|jgi:DNA-binding transcriptional LysR family regulator|nr:LysR family transcriptional regulator [Puniceicoccales bacterium]
MHIENFKVFADLAASKSFSQSARINGITQSAVSQQLRSLENHFKVQVLDHSRKQFHLTCEGEKIYESIKKILHEYNQLTSDLREMTKLVDGTVNISSIYSVGIHELPEIVKKFLIDYPAVNIRIAYRRSDMVVEDVLHHSADLGLLAYPEKTRSLEILPFGQDSLVLICSPQHPLASSEEIPISALDGQNFISFTHDMPTCRAIEQIFQNENIKLNNIKEFDNIETIKHAVEINAGLAIVPAATVRQEIAQGNLVQLRLSNCQINRPLAIIHRRSFVLTPAMRKFIQLLTDFGNHDENTEFSTLTQQPQ